MSLYDLGDVAKLQLSTFDAAGTPADATDVGLSVTKPDGSATTVALGGLTHTPSSGIYSYSMPLTMVGPHSARWAATGANQAADVRRFDVYGATICEPAELRDRYPALTPAKQTDAALRRALRAAVEQWNELARVAMAPFARRITRLGDGRSVLPLPDLEVRSIVTLTIAGTTIDASAYELDGGAGLLYLTSGVFSAGATVVVHYEHGLDHPPGAVVDAVMQRAFELAVPPEAGSGRTTSVANELGFSRLSIAGRDGSTGVPDFDSTAALYGRQGFGFA